jgi:hypothetical protein
MEILKVIELIPRSINEEMNDFLRVEILEGGVLTTLEVFQKIKIQGPNGLSMDFFISFYDLIKKDLLKVVQESLRSDQILGSFNKTFLALIPQK